ncbi:MAG TPA: glycosyltransferase family 39 protein [Lunatimonas sp.]|nr:glycosyltransferase family 39 protein [Lunatimonas sp.]
MFIKKLSASTTWNNSPWFILGVFLLLIGPFSLNFHFHYPDEMYYSDAALQMIKNGDFFTTYLGNGELRFKKPILTYWAVLAGFKIFGISAFSSRILFLAAGGALIGLVYAIGKLASGNKSIAALAGWMIAAQPLVIFSSSRSIPDILLVLFVTLSAWGVTAALKYGDDVPKKYLWMIFLGFGLAFEVKGLPAAALGFLALGYLLVNPYQRISWKKLFYWPAVLAGLVISVSWFVIMYAKFGPEYLNSFIEDQVGMRVGQRVTLIVRYFFMAAGLMVALFLPWLLFTGKKTITSFLIVKDENKAFFGFVLVWLVAIILMTSLVSKFYDRYLLPVAPLVTVGVAWMIVRGQGNNRKNLNGWGIAILAINALVLIVAVYWNIGLESPLMLAIHWMIGAGLCLFLFIIFRRNILQFQHLSLAIMLVFFNGCLISYPLSIPHEGVQIDDLFEEKNIPLGTKVGFIGNPHHSSKIRIGLDTDYELINLEGDSIEQINEYELLICGEDSIIKFELNDNQSEIASINWDAKYFLEIMGSIWKGDTSLRKYELSKKYYLVETRKQR